MDGIDAFDNWYITHPRLAEFADPLFVHKPKQSRDFARRLRGKKSVSQDMAGSYAKDVIDAMPVRTKRNLHAFIGTGIARTANGVIPYFVRSNGDTAAVLPVDGDFGPGVYASTRSKPYAKSLNEIVAEHLNEVEAPAEKIATADSLATRLSDVRSDISDARATAEWHDLNGVARVGQADLDSLMTMLKDKDFSGMRQWVVDNIDTDPIAIYRQMYDQMHQYLQPQSIPQVVLLIADYQYKQAFVQDAEINLVAFLTEVMVEVEWK